MPTDTPPAHSKKTNAVVALGGLRETLGFHIAKAAVETGKAFTAFVSEPLGLRKVEYSLLLILQANPALLPKQLASVLSITAPNLTTLLDKFEQQGWASRLPNPEDGRSQLVHLTPSGRALATRCEEIGADMAAHWVGRLSQAESQLLNRLLIKLYGAGDAPTSDVTSDVTSE